MCLSLYFLDDDSWSGEYPPKGEKRVGIEFVPVIEQPNAQ